MKTTKEIIKAHTMVHQLVDALAVISRDFLSPNELRESCEEMYGLEYEEALEMSFENMQSVATKALIEFEKLQKKSPDLF